MTSVVVTVLGNQPEAFASDLGDDQSRYLLIIVIIIVIIIQSFLSHTMLVIDTELKSPPVARLAVIGTDSEER